MTCIAAIRTEDGDIYIGGDSAGIDADSLLMGLHVETKVWQEFDMVFGMCGSFRVAQVIRYHTPIPEDHYDDPLEYLTGPFANALRETLHESGTLSIWDEDSTEEINESGLIVGYKGRVFEIMSDFGVGELVNGYASIGCGYPLALGSLASTESLDMGPEERILMALNVAERHSAGVAGPMKILKLPTDPS